MKKYFTKEKWLYALRTISHPADCYYWIRHQERGSVPIACIFVILFSISFSINRISASFIVNDVDPRDVNAITELFAVLLLYVLFCVGNWSITCLMGGEGRLKDIAIAVGYALTPMIVTYNVGTIFSQYVAQNEDAFYWMIIAIGIAYSVFMALIGVMQVHNYSLGKTLLVILLTFVAMFIIIFILLLFINLISQVYSFGYSIYQELIFRA